MSAYKWATCDYSTLTPPQWIVAKTQHNFFIFGGVNHFIAFWVKMHQLYYAWPHLALFPGHFSYGLGMRLNPTTSFSVLSSVCSIVKLCSRLTQVHLQHQLCPAHPYTAGSFYCIGEMYRNHELEWPVTHKLRWWECPVDTTRVRVTGHSVCYTTKLGQ